MNSFDLIKEIQDVLLLGDHYLISNTNKLLRKYPHMNKPIAERVLNRWFKIMFQYRTVPNFYMGIRIDAKGDLELCQNQEM